MSKPSDLPPVDRVPRPALAPMEAYYYRALVHWYKYKSQPPTLLEFCLLCRKSGAPMSITEGTGRRKKSTWPSVRAVRRGLLALAAKGYATHRNGKFEVSK